MSLRWTCLNSILLLGVIFLQTATSIPYHGRSTRMTYARSPHTVDLHLVPGITVHQSAGTLQSVPFKSSLTIPNDNYTSLLSVQAGYGISVLIGGQAMMLALDTSSSDVWIAESYFNCIDLVGALYPQSYCRTGPTISSTIGCGTGDIEDVHFNVQYADYNGASGPMAVFPLQVADEIKINQQIGIARNVVTLFGRDNTTSGVLGLAYPSLTSAYEGTDIWATNECLMTNAFNSPDGAVPHLDPKGCGRQPYTSLSENLFPPNSTSTQNSTLAMRQQVFSLALSRGTVGNLYGGSITFGGLPDIMSQQVNAGYPLVIVSNEPLNSDPGGELKYYVVSVKSIVLPVNTGAPVSNTSIGANHTLNGHLGPAAAMRRRTITNNHEDIAEKRGNHYPQAKTFTIATSPQASQFIIDSSSPLSYFPSHITKAYNSLFQPPAYRLYHGGPWMLNCSALAYVPPLGLIIGGETFWHNTEDLVIREKRWASDVQGKGDVEVCYSAVQEGFVEFRGTVGSVWDGGIERGQSDFGDDDGNDDKNGRFTLGQPFLKNVLAVFDVGSGEIGLMSRVDYEV